MNGFHGIHDVWIEILPDGFSSDPDSILNRQGRRGSVSNDTDPVDPEEWASTIGLSLIHI